MYIWMNYSNHLVLLCTCYVPIFISVLNTTDYINIGCDYCSWPGVQYHSSLHIREPWISDFFSGWETEANPGGGREAAQRAYIAFVQITWLFIYKYIVFFSNSLKYRYHMYVQEPMPSKAWLYARSGRQREGASKSQRWVPLVINIKILWR